MLPPELQKVSLTCPSCQKGLSFALETVFRKASVTCTNCNNVIGFQGPMISRTLQMMSEVEKAGKRVEEARTEYSKSIERFKASVSDLLKTARSSS